MLAAGKKVADGKKVAVVERELIGGECAYWACIPSKTLLRPPEARSEASRAFGTGTLTLDLEEVFDYRDSMIRNLGDSDQVITYEEKDATAIKGDAVRGRRDGLLPGLRRRWWGEYFLCDD